ncbi:MAG: Ni/Fe-hydrogenase, b-type cytochrome subunit [Nitrospiraceae bacterium]|nr:Ni/Fe-hydrogenase, b-type cytochrome subunit [Nitrospiraceae bacterium]
MTERKRVYIWEVPVRLTHWVNFFSIIALSVTGIYIGNPYLHPLSESSFTMGTMRFIHLTAAYLFLMMIIIRLYWAFAGNRYANWRVFLPLKKRQRQDLGDATRYYLFMSRKPPYAAGHTMCAGVAYFVLFLMFLFQIFSGFALWSYTRSVPFFHMVLGGWMLGFWNVSAIRFWHHMVMYFIWAIALVHVYLAVWLDSAEHNGLMGSIFGGYKFITGKEWE